MALGSRENVRCKWRSGVLTMALEKPTEEVETEVDNDDQDQEDAEDLDEDEEHFKCS